MNHNHWLSLFLQFLILLPTAASCYLPAKNQLKYTGAKTAALCITILIPYCLAATWVCMALSIDTFTLLLPALCLFFFLYRQTVNMDLPRSLAIYVGVCAIETFPAQFAYSLDAWLHPLSNARDFSAEAALFQLFLSCLLLIAFIVPARRYFSWSIKNLNFPQIWYSTAVLSMGFLVFNVLTIPRHYSTLQVGRLSYLFPLMEVCALAVLITIYVLFYLGTTLILKKEKLEKRSQLLEIQSHQYQILQEHMHQTARLRHDFRHSVRLLTSLANQNDIDSIKTYLAEYDSQLPANTPINYCSNTALNALFGYYYEKAHSAQIETDWKLELPEPLTISELDLASLFGNIMENAIAACRRVPDDLRYFYLTAEIRHGNSLYVVSTNSFDGKIKKGTDGYYSTRHDGKGIGLASITSIAEKYHGHTRISNDSKEFFVDVLLKI